VFDALAAKAQEVKIDFAGHVPLAVGLHRALEARYRSIDHLDGYVEAMSKTPMQSQFFGINLMSDIDETKIPALVAETKKAGTWMVPTQVLFDNLFSDDDPTEMAKRPELKYQEPQGMIQKWISQKQVFLRERQSGRFDPSGCEPTRRHHEHHEDCWCDAGGEMALEGRAEQSDGRPLILVNAQPPTPDAQKELSGGWELAVES